MSLKTTLCMAIALIVMLSLCGLATADEGDLVWSTFLGGSEGEGGYGIAVDGFENAYVSGYTYGADFPTTSGAFDTTHNGSHDVFVAKLNRSGNGLVYATFLGGGFGENGWSIAVDGRGNAYVTGSTGSSDFPATAGAFDTTYNGGWDVFVAKLGPTGGALSYATFLGGSGGDRGRGIAVDDAGDVYVVGYTESMDFPVTSEVCDTTQGGSKDVFVARIDESGSNLIYATYLGGSEPDEGNGIAVDDDGRAYVTGSTWSSDFPVTLGAFDTAFSGVDGDHDAFVTELDSDGSGLIFSSFLGGSGYDKGYGIVLDGAGDIYVTGGTLSEDFPTTPGAFDTSYNWGGGDIFVTRVSIAGSTLVFSTFLGGSDEEGIYGWGGIQLDGLENIYLTGQTHSGDFPVTAGALDTTFNGGDSDVFVARLNASGTTLDYSTFLGGNGDEEGRSIAVDEEGHVYLTGLTTSLDFPTTAGAFDRTLNGGSDAFAARLELTGMPAPILTSSFQVAGGRDEITLYWVTASEMSCQRWEIYRREGETGDFIKIGELPGHGTTETAHSYRWVDRQVLPGTMYYYRLKQVDAEDRPWWSSTRFATAGLDVPLVYMLEQNFPNPFNAETEIEYALPEDVAVIVKVYDVRGAEVATLVDEEQQAGFYTAHWNAAGMTSGVYFCTIQAGDFHKSIKMIYLK